MRSRHVGKIKTNIHCVPEWSILLPQMLFFASFINSISVWSVSGGTRGKHRPRQILGGPVECFGRAGSTMFAHRPHHQMDRWEQSVGTCILRPVRSTGGFSRPFLRSDSSVPRTHDSGEWEISCRTTCFHTGRAGSLKMLISE